MVQGVVSSAAQGITGDLLDPRGRVQPPSGPYTDVLRPESGLVETSVHTRQGVVAESGGNPHPCVQALLPETGVLEEPGGIQDPCPGIMARIQPAPCPPL